MKWIYIVLLLSIGLQSVIAGDEVTDITENATEPLSVSEKVKNLPLLDNGSE